VIYLMFNEGYLASMRDELHRPDLCTEALQLGRQLCDVLPGEAESLGLLVLMLLQDSRRDARIRDGQLITLEEHDRSLWDPIEISEGLGLVEAALRSGPVGPYQLQAAIAAAHVEAKTSAETDWRQIAALYEKLLEINPSSVVALNQAVAIAMADGYEAGLKQIDAVGSSGELDGYHLFHAARADLLRRMEHFYEAADEC
jgi:RNA polymerase sigma-70 factor (ECF subfamily)